MGIIDYGVEGSAWKSKVKFGTTAMLSAKAYKTEFSKMIGPAPRDKSAWKGDQLPYIVTKRELHEASNPS